MLTRLLDPYEAIRFALMGVFEVIRTVTAARLLRIQSRKTYYAFSAAYFTLDAILKPFDSLALPRLVIGHYLCRILVTLLMSTCSIRTRVARLASLEFCPLLIEIAAMSVYALMTGGEMVPDSIGPDNVGDVVLVYLIMIVASAVILGAIMAAFERTDGEAESLTRLSSLPTVLLFLGSLIFIWLNLYKANPYEAKSLPQAASLVAWCWLALVGSGVVYAVARREAESRLEAAEAALAARGARHTRAEVEALAARARGMESLRHELANDARAVRRLAESGDVAGADRRLVALQEQARVLTGGNNE